MELIHFCIPTLRFMIENLPVYTYMVFALATLATALLLYKASGFSRTVAYCTGGLLVFQGGIAATGFYTVVDSFPPRFLIALCHRF